MHFLHVNFLLNLRFSRAFYLLQFKFAKTDATGNNRIYHLEESLAEALVHFANAISKKGKKKNANASNRIYCPEEFSTRRFYFQSLLNRCTKTGIFFSKKQGRKKQVQEKLQKKHCCWDVACIQCRPKLSTSCAFTVTTKIALSKKNVYAAPL